MTESEAWKTLAEAWRSPGCTDGGSRWVSVDGVSQCFGLCDCVLDMESGDLAKAMMARLERHRDGRSVDNYWWPLDDHKSRVEFCERMAKEAKGEELLDRR